MSVIPSPKSYAVSVCLCMVFGVAGIHHLYLGRWLSFAFDFSLLVLTLYFWFTGEILLAVAFGVIDALHTFIITIMLFVGSFKDGKGLTVCYPGQKIS